MKSIQANSGLKVKASVKAGGLGVNHTPGRAQGRARPSRPAASSAPTTTAAPSRCSSAVKAGGLTSVNHNRSALAIG